MNKKILTSTLFLILIILAVPFFMIVCFDDKDFKDMIVVNSIINGQDTILKINFYPSIDTSSEYYNEFWHEFMFETYQEMSLKKAPNQLYINDTFYVSGWQNGCGSMKPIGLLEIQKTK